jgi:hypothetical protein
VCCGKDIKHATPSITTAAATVNRLKVWDRNCTIVQELYTDSLYAQLFDDLNAESVNCCGNFRPNTRMVLRVLDRNEISRGLYRMA